MFLQKCFNDELDKLKFNKINSVFYKNLKYVGRLDYKTTGVLLLTNDGDFARKLTLPSSNIERTYIATVNSTDFSHLDKARHGMVVDGIKYAPMKIEEIGGNDLRITITEGKKNVMRLKLDVLYREKNNIYYLVYLIEKNKYV